MHNSIKLIVSLFLIMIFLFGITSSFAAKPKEDIYDVILFFGQSNMVGSAYPDPEDRHIGRESVFSKETGIDLDIVKKINNRANVGIVLNDGVAYEYIYSPDTYGRKNELVSGNLYPITNGAWFCTGEFLTYSGGRVVAASESTAITQYSGCTNIIPEFCRTYNQKTGHKVIAVVVARGGTSLSSFAQGSLNKIMEIKYKAAIDYCIANNMNVGNRFFVCFQGENEADNPATVSPSKITSEYKNYFKKLADGMKSWGTNYSINNGAIIETGAWIYQSPIQSVNAVHQAQEELIKEHYAILGSNYPYNSYVPIWSEYDLCTTDVCYDDKNKSSKGEYGYVYAKATERVDSNYFVTGSVEKAGDYNKIHFTAAALSQIGRETAKNLAKISSNNISIPATNNNILGSTSNVVEATSKPQATNVKTTPKPTATTKPTTTKSVKTATPRPVATKKPTTPRAIKTATPRPNPITYRNSIVSQKSVKSSITSSFKR